ncbi:hypothetical protein ACIBCT_37265 [Streptosporangium sp. NPDC050855]|uniref:hypothetical protein n=1 Tax=Streptosporangium sp. NPDC050855 TaxID=3366194 RepID=UPI0037909435
MATDNRKRAIRERMATTGEPYSQAALHVDHSAPDLRFLAELPYAAGQTVDLRLAAATVAGCRAGCASCQKLLIPRLLADRPTVAVLAGGVYGLWPTAGPLASPPTRAWHPLVRQAHDSGEGTRAWAAIEAMSDGDLAQVLDDALDHWAAGGATIASPVLLDLPHDQADEDEADDGPPVSYVLYPGTVTSPAGPLPTLVLAPESSGAGVEDLRARCASHGWQSWDLIASPEVDPAWRIRAEIASRSIEEIAHVDAEGGDDITLWQAPEAVRLPDNWWDLLDRVQHVLLCGPVADSSQAALENAARAGDLMAVIGRVSFL